MKALLLSCLILLLSCEHKNENSTKISQTRIEKGLKVTETLSFRRSYVGHDTMSDKELEQLHLSNPTLETYDSSAVLVKKLNTKNLLKQSELLLDAFENKEIKSQYLDKNRQINLTTKTEKEDPSKIHLILNHDKTHQTKILDFKGDHILGTILEDINDDGIKEVLILTNFYIMNGDNYVLTIVQYD